MSLRVNDAAADLINSASYLFTDYHFAYHWKTILLWASRAFIGAPRRVIAQFTLPRCFRCQRLHTCSCVKPPLSPFICECGNQTFIPLTCIAQFPTKINGKVVTLERNTHACCGRTRYAWFMDSPIDALYGLDFPVLDETYINWYELDKKIENSIPLDKINERLQLP